MKNWLLLAMLATIFIVACASVPPGDPFAGEGVAWPAPPQPARIQYIGEFSGPGDLGLQRSFWQRVTTLMAGSADTALVRPMAVAAVGDAGQIYVADPGAACVHRFDRVANRYQCLVGPGGTRLPSPVGLAVSAGGQLYVADSRLGRVLTAGPEDRELRFFDDEADFRQPTGLAWDRSRERLFVVDTRAQSVSIMTSSGEVVGEIGGRGTTAGRMNFPTFAWFSDDDELLVSDSLNFRIQRFDNNGATLGDFGEPGLVSGTLARPKGVATDRFGHVYVVDALLHAMQIFDRQGRLLLAIGNQGQDSGQFWLPGGVFVDGHDRIFVADSYNGRVQVFRYVGDET